MEKVRNHWLVTLKFKIFIQTYQVNVDSIMLTEIISHYKQDRNLVWVFAVNLSEKTFTQENLLSRTFDCTTVFSQPVYLSAQTVVRLSMSR